MNKPWRYLAYVLTFLVASQLQAFGQEDQDLEKLARLVEKLVNDAESEAQELGEDHGKIIEAQAKQIEKWVESYSRDWEKWAERFEKKMEKMAEKHEAKWTEWAEQYTERWDNWAEKLESGKLDTAELDKLVEQNLKLMAEMPIGDLIESTLKETMGELEDAPLESLAELGQLVERSLHQSLEQLDKIDPAQYEEKAKKYWDSLTRLKQQLNSDSEWSELSKDKLKKLEKLLKSKKLNREQRRAIELSVLQQTQAMEQQRQALEALQQKRSANRAQLDNRRAAEKARSLAEAARVQSAEARKRAELAQKAAVEKAKAYMEKAAKRSVQKKRDKEKAAAGKVPANLKTIYEAIAQQADKIESREKELLEMSREIKRLRNEIRKLKNEKGDD